MFKYVSAGLAVVLVAALAYVQVLDGRIKDRDLQLTTVTRERDNLRSELATAQERLRQSQRAQVAAAEALSRANAASRELASIKDWIRGNEDAPIPAWFDDLLVRLGLSVRPDAAD